MKLAETLPNEPQTRPKGTVPSERSRERRADLAGDPSFADGALGAGVGRSGGSDEGAETARLAEAAARYLDAWERNQAEISVAGLPPGLDPFRR